MKYMTYEDVLDDFDEREDWGQLEQEGTAQAELQDLMSNNYY